MFEKAQASGFQKHATFAPASQKLLGFRLRSPHLFGEEPCPLSLQTVFSPHSPSLIHQEGQGRTGAQNLTGAMPFPCILVINLHTQNGRNSFEFALNL